MIMLQGGHAMEACLTAILRNLRMLTTQLQASMLGVARGPASREFSQLLGKQNRLCFLRKITPTSGGDVVQ